MKNILFGITILLFFLSLTGLAQDRKQPFIPRHAGNFFDPGYILEDRNRDSITDYIQCTLVLPQNPSESEIASAANIAARLGYETTSADFNRVGYDSDKNPFYDQPVIIIGSRNRLTNKSDELKNRVGKGLKPGQGDICFFKHDEFFRKGGVAITGYDATGLLASANYFAGRFPEIWNLDGKKFSDVHTQFTEFFAGRNINQQEIFSSRIVIDADSPGVKKLVLHIDFPDCANLDSAKMALTRKKKDEPDGDNSKNDSVPENKVDRASLDFFGLHRIEIDLQCPGKREVIDLLPMKEWVMEKRVSNPAANTSDFSLSQLYTLTGIFTDNNRDYVPDHVNAYLSMDGEDAAQGIIDFSFRTGLETAGMRLPFVVVAGEEEHPEKPGFPILFGRDHYSIKKLEKEERIHGVSSEPGIGFIQFIPEAFQKRHAMVISGTDQEGMKSVSDYLSRRMPYLWKYGKGNYLLEDIEEDIRKFFQVKNAPGQAAVAIHKLKTWMDRIADKEIESLNIELALKESPEGLTGFTEDLVKEYFPKAAVDIDLFTTGYGVGKTIFEENVEIPWEVDEFWSLFRDEALSELDNGARGIIEVRVSESPEVRAQIKQQIKDELNANGIDPASFEIVVLSAYKQGFSWLHDYILPKIREREIGEIAITYHTLKESDEIRWQTVNANTRWLQEIFPIDTILARELNIPASKITFHRQVEKDPIYTVTVTDPEGKLILEESFDPKYVIRPFFDLFPEYESVRVTTGWVFVQNGDRVILDKRIKTDPEKFWDHLQTETYRKIIDYVMDVQDGKPSVLNAPYFDELKVELTLSEPNYRLGIDEEVISSTEALHEDIMFHTLALFNRIGGRYGVGGLPYPGRILPLLNSPVDGKPGNARITFTGKEKATPEVFLSYKEADHEMVTQRYTLVPMDVKTPLLRGIELKHGMEGINKLLFDVVATDSVDRYEEFKARGSEIQIDLAFIPVEKLTDMVNILGKLQQKGMYGEALSYDKVTELMFRVTLEDSIKYSRLVSLKQNSTTVDTDKNALPAITIASGVGQIIQWNRPMPPGEVAIDLSILNRFPEINAYYMATSFLGHNVYAADILLPVDGKYISQAKLNALKPTLMLIGRVHGNEVSSTSHQLKLAEWCATDTAYRKFLKKVNLVIYPMVNPDGAQTAYEMFLENPDFMLHAGRYGALGYDVPRGGRNADHIYPEAGVVGRLRETWLPDVFVDMHGVPTHEWVQYFAGYSAWVNSRVGGARNYWLPRGWYIPGFSWIEDKEYPELMKVQKAITDSITTGVMSLQEVKAMNDRFYDRYIKYGKQDPDTYREYFYEGVQLEARLKGRKVSESGITGSNITYYAITTESADETAYGEWLQLVCTAGLANSTALLNYLANGVNRIECQTEDHGDFVTRSVFRKKPVLPYEKEQEK